MSTLPAARRASAAEVLWRSRPRVNLVIVAHPDDAELRFGATMLHLVGRGEKVVIVVASDGRLGCTAPVPVPKLVRRRKAEQLEAARLAGVSGVYFMGLPDGELQSLKPRLKERIVYFIRRLRPSTVFTYDPSLFYFPRETEAGFHRAFGAISHPDHRAVGEACLDAIYCGSALRHCFPAHARRGLEPWAIDEVYLAAAAHPNVVARTRPYLRDKRALMRVYRSQGSWQWLDYAAALEKDFRHIPCSHEGYERGLRRDSPAPERRSEFFVSRPPNPA
ncbi:MAG: PIG-L deacetylase family protein [Elusimicrobiota bacterium]